VAGFAFVGAGRTGRVPPPALSRETRREDGFEHQYRVPPPSISASVRSRCARNSATSGDERLFPELRQDNKGVLTGNFSKWFGRYLRESVGIKDRRKTFHSFRHTFKDVCREAEVSQEVHDALTGVSGARLRRSRTAAISNSRQWKCLDALRESGTLVG
jgi:integrase